jgi:hypothetical protein
MSEGAATRTRVITAEPWTWGDDVFLSRAAVANALKLARANFATRLLTIAIRALVRSYTIMLYFWYSVVGLLGMVCWNDCWVRGL